MTSVPVPLKHPVPLAVGHLIQVDVQRVRVGDRLAMERGTALNGIETEGSIAFVASNTGLDIDLVARIDDADFVTIVQKIDEISTDAVSGEDPAQE